MMGRTLAHYEITAELGRGGMGEVYRARDTKLNREVAIKVLPEAFAVDSDRRKRFEREAQLLAALNHPNIAAIYGIEANALVLELVEGPTLAERLGEGPLPVDEAVAIAGQIASGLEAAHEKGIIHRDLKPGNVKLTEAGDVKILDFGLAKAMEAEGSAEGGAELGSSHSPTMTRAATAAGVLLGTAAYMSPEQARGKTVDRRADVWAFGCLLYEMLTGKRLFDGETVSDTLAAVLTREPDYGLLPASTPQTVRRALARCLERDPKKRFRDLGDVRIEMSEPVPVGVGSEISAPTSPTPSRRRMALVLALTAAAVIGAAISALVLRSTTAPAPAAAVYRYRIAISSADFESARSIRVSPGFAISPDGRWLAYRVDNSSGRSGSLYLRGLDEWDARPLPGTEDGIYPFFSSDGKNLAFLQRRAAQLYRMSVPPDGSGPQPIPGKIESWRYAARGVWLDDGSIVYSSGGGDLWRLPTGGGDPVRLIAPDDEGTRYLFPERVPGTSTILYTAIDANPSRIEALSLESGERKVVTEGSFPKLAPSSGHLLFFRPPLPTLLAAPFDWERLELTGDALPVVEGVSTDGTILDLAVADNGTMVYRPTEARQGEPTFPVVVDRKGQETKVFDREGDWSEPRLSPDGRQLLIRLGGSPDCSLWLYDFGRGTLSRTTLEGDSHDPAWIAGTGRIVFRDPKRGVILTQPTDGSGTARPIRTGATEITGSPQSVSPDGSTLLVTRGSPNDLWIVPLDGAGEPRAFLATEFSENTAVFSPDGRFVAYTSDVSGRNEVYVRPYPGPGAVVQVSNDGGEQPRWSGDGRELFYLSGGRVMAAATSLTPEFRANRPGVLFEGNFDTASLGGSGNYDVSPDGQRFLMVKSAAPNDEAIELRVILNWPELLKRREP